MPDREARLDAIREEARRHGRVEATTTVPIAGGPLPPTAPAGYYGQPVLKAPVWTWEVPAYFVVGGVAGMAALVAAVAGVSRTDPGVAADARLVALAGVIVAPLLLISDLGRPARFLNMLRVFKRQSVMSVGAWTLVAFSASVAASVAAHALPIAAERPSLLDGLDVVTATLGLVLATYTGVLLGVSTVPVWAAHATRLPWLFAASSLGAAVSVLELAGHLTPALNAVGIAAAAGDITVSLAVTLRGGPASAAIRQGSAGLWLRTADLGGAVLPLALRMLAPASVPARLTAAVATIAGACILRYGWMAAGRVSTRDAAVVLDEPAR